MKINEHEREKTRRRENFHCHQIATNHATIAAMSPPDVPDDTVVCGF
jgi:hypothetical protein